MFVDCRNVIYRAVLACRTHNEHARVRGFNQPKKLAFPLLLNMLSGWINTFEPVTVQTFWDAPRSTVWRRDLFEDYKNRDPLPDPAIARDIAACEDTASAMFEYMNIRQFRKDRMEADDLIYAACRAQCVYDLVVVSSDGDMQQLLYITPKIRIYNPDTRTTMTVDNANMQNPVWYKALKGDVSDKIPGYDGIGPKTADKILKDPKKLAILLDQKGKDTLVRNLKLIDLSMSPYTIINQLYIYQVLATSVLYDKERIRSLCDVYHIFMYELVDSLTPFKGLI